VKYKLQVVEKETDSNFTTAELEIFLNIYEDRLEMKIENDRLKRSFNVDLTLEETCDLIEYKRRIDLEAVVDNIKDRFQTIVEV
jgi:hypothetical protein